MTFSRGSRPEIPRTPASKVAKDGEDSSQAQPRESEATSGTSTKSGKSRWTRRSGSKAASVSTQTALASSNPDSPSTPVAGQRTGAKPPPDSAGRPKSVHGAKPKSGETRSGARIEIGDRLAEKRAVRRRLHVSRLAAITGAVVVLGVAFYALWLSPLFALRSDSIVVEGIQSGSDYDQVLSTLDPYVGTPLLRVREGAVRDELESLPFVSEADAKRRWPSGIVLQIEEREPVMVVKADSGLELLGADGIVVASVRESDQNLVEVELSADDSQERQSEAKNAYEAYEALEPSLADAVESLSVEGDQITLFLNTGQRVVWGSPEQSALKSQIVTLLLAERAAPIYDVSDPSRPTTRLNEEPTTQAEEVETEEEENQG